MPLCGKIFGVYSGVDYDVPPKAVRRYIVWQTMSTEHFDVVELQMLFGRSTCMLQHSRKDINVEVKGFYLRASDVIVANFPLGIVLGWHTIGENVSLDLGACEL
jgi:hypothetical protein